MFFFDTKSLFTCVLSASLALKQLFDLLFLVITYITFSFERFQVSYEMKILIRKITHLPLKIKLQKCIGS